MGHMPVAPARRTEGRVKCRGDAPNSKAESTYVRPPSRNGAYGAPGAVSFCEAELASFRRPPCPTQQHQDKPWVFTTCSSCTARSECILPNVYA